ncbi:MAG: ABC transporter permease [Actinomycetes bacterium]
MIIGRYEVLLEQRTDVRRSSAVVVPAASIIGALVIAGIFLGLTGHPALSVYQRLVRDGYGSWYAFTDTLAQATPLILTGLAAAFAFRMNLYNIGAEGQLYAGAIAASWAGLAIAPNLPGPLAVLVVLLAGALGGALWILIPALARARFQASEIVSTLLFNYVALYLMQYLIFGSASYWRDPNSKNFPQGKPLPDVAHFPLLHFPSDVAGLRFPSGVTSVHLGLLVGLLAIVVLWFVTSRTGFGFDTRVVANSERAARYAGIPIARTVVVVLLVSGALAGLAGAGEVGGRAYALDPNGLVLGLGYTGIVVAALARYNPFAVGIVAFLLAGLRTGAEALQTASGSLRVPIAIAFMLEGAILLAALGGEVFRRNRLVVRRISEVTA